MKHKLKFLKVSESNIEELSQGISELDFIVHKRKHNLAYWRWRYLNAPVGQSSVIIATRGSQVVGRYALLYTLLMVKNKPLLAGLMSDLIIHPLEKSWQCYRGLIETHISEGKKDTLAFRFGIAPYRVMKLNKRMNVISLGVLPIYFGFLNIPNILKGRSIPYPLSLAGWVMHPFLGLKTKEKKVSGVDIKPIESFDSNFDELWSDTNKKNFVGVIKNTAYLNWRYVQCPDCRYWRLAAYRNNKLEGLIVFSVTGLRQGGCILELLVRDDDPVIMRMLILRAFKTMDKEGIGCITVSFPLKSITTVILRAFGFHSWIKKIRPTQIIITSNFQGKPYPKFDLKNYNFSLGDWLNY
jgi:hypothetical protein